MKILNLLKKSVFRLNIFFYKILGLQVIIELKNKLHNYKVTYASDGIITSFQIPFNDTKLKKSIQRVEKILNKDIYDKWRQYIYTFFFEKSFEFIKKENIILECGVGLGVRNLVTLNYLKKKKLKKNKIYLIDSFQGLNPSFKNKINIEHTNYIKEQFSDNKNYSFEQAKKNFSEYKQVNIIKGFIPEILYKNKKIFKKKISFLHLDLNDGLAELKAIKFLYPFLAKKYIIILDDYLFNNNESKKIYKLINDFCLNKKIQKPIGLPSGQGIIFKF